MITAKELSAALSEAELRELNLAARDLNKENNRFKSPIFRSFFYNSQVARHKRMGWKPPMHPIKGYKLKGGLNDDS